MSRSEILMIRLSTFVSGASGLIYAAMKYLMTPTDEWSVVNHPWQPHVQHLHVLSAPLLIFAVALVWKQHAIANATSGEAKHRNSGLCMVLLFWPMVLSGFLQQVSVADGWRQIWATTHLVSSLLWLAATLAHLAVTALTKYQASQEVRLLTRRNA